RRRRRGRRARRQRGRGDRPRRARGRRGRRPRVGRMNGTAAGTRRDREAALFARLRDLPSLVVAYSGGVDSAYLAWAATAVLGERALAVTADSASYPARHRAMAIDLAKRFGLCHEIVHTAEIDRPEYR